MEEQSVEDWGGFAILREGCPPSGDPMKVYLSKLDRYLKDQGKFSKEGFTFPVAKKVIALAQLNGQELYVLFYYAKRIPDGGTYLEVGSWVGGSLMCAYEATKVAKTKVNFITIDRVVRRQLLVNTERIPRLTIIHCATDHTAEQIDRIKDESVDLLFIDGSHEYKQVKKDLENYWPKLNVGGVLLGHDYGPRGPGVVKAVNEKFGRKRVEVLPNSKVSKIFMTEKIK